MIPNKNKLDLRKVFALQIIGTTTRVTIHISVWLKYVESENRPLTFIPLVYIRTNTLAR